MKKSVRIRKALPGEKPGYYNKTAKFLKKAQMGMNVDSPSNDPQRLNTIYTNVYASLISDITPDVVYSSLISEYGLDEQTALMLLRTALGKLAEEGKIDPDSLEGGNSQQNQKQEEQPNETQDRESQEEYDQRVSEDAEQDELAMSDEGYYDEEEAANNDNSHLDTEEDEQQQAFRFGGYRQDGGESDEDYSDYYDDSSQNSSPEKAVINQYNNPGQNKMQKPFSIEDLIGMTPGIQGTQSIPGIEDYLGDYRPISESYGSMDYLPQAQNGLNLLPGFTRALEQGLEAFNKGYSGIRSLTPMTNMSGIRKAAPIGTLTGEGITRLPLIGNYFQPQLKTTFTQNRNHLWEILNGAEPNKDIFGKVGTRTNSDGSLQVNRLMLYQDDVDKIISRLEAPSQNPPLQVEADGTVSWDYSNNASNSTSNKVFNLGEIQPIASQDGLVSGVYPMDSKIVGGVDDEGNKFFEISHKFGPNQTLPFGSTSNRAKKINFKNRFYYNSVVDPATNQISYKVFGPLGEELTAGSQTKYQIKRPFIPSVLKTEAESLLRDPNTPFPDFTTGFGTNPTARFTSRLGRTDVSSTPPSTVDRLSGRGKVGRALENFALSTYVPQIFGLGNPLRTSPENVTQLELPVLGYASSHLGPNVVNPALETGVANDIANAMNYKYRIGRNALLGAGALGYLGYKGWEAMYPCQCDSPSIRNYMPKDKYGNCPCGGDVGSRRILDPKGQQTEEFLQQDKLDVPDSMKFLIKRGVYPTTQDYYRLKGKNKRSQALDYKTGGQIPKFQPGGEQRLLQLYTEGLRDAESLYEAYRNAPFGSVRPATWKNNIREIPNLPEFLNNEQLAQRSNYYWPTHQEIENALDIQRRLLSGEIGTEDIIPTPLWRQRSNNENLYPRHFTNIAEMPGLSETLGLTPEERVSALFPEGSYEANAIAEQEVNDLDWTVLPVQNNSAPQTSPLRNAFDLENLSYENMINLKGEALEDWISQRQEGFRTRGSRPYPLSIRSRTGEIMLSPKFDNTPDNNVYSLFANMTSPIEAGRTLNFLQNHGVVGTFPQIKETNSLSLDSFPLLINMGNRKDWDIIPLLEREGKQGYVRMNNMGKHNKIVMGPNTVGLDPEHEFSPLYPYTEDQVEHIKTIFAKDFARKNLKDLEGNIPQLKVVFNPGSSHDYYWPNYIIKRRYETGGITQNQFIKAFKSKFKEGGPQDQVLGQGKRMDTLTNDVEARKNIFKNKLKDNSNVALTKEIYKNAQSNPQILNILMQNGPKENLAENTGMQTASRGGVPDWYTGYNTSLTPKEYRKLYRQIQRMMPRGLDISKANMASNFYDKRFMQPGYGAVVSTPEYMNMLAISSLPMYKSAANVYGGGRKSSHLQADEATLLNNEKGIPLLSEMTSDFVDSPIRNTGYIVPASDDAIEGFFKNKRAPIVGETWDTWYTSDGSTPGFAPDTRTWDGTQWVGPSPTERLQQHAQGGFVDMDAENPLVRFIYGGDETDYYEPYGIPMAQNGINILNHDNEQRVVGDKLNFDDWAEGEKDDFATTHPGVDFDTWKTDPTTQDEYKKYEDFYNNSLHDYLAYDDPNVNPNSNNNSPINNLICPPGYVWNATYNTCIPVAKINYNPRVVRGQSGLFRNLAPWNPAFSYAGSWIKQMSLPYQLGSGNPYMGQLTGAPAARYVTKKGIFGKPKKWIDIYDVDGSGEAINPLEIEQLIGQQGRGSGRMKAPKGPSRRDMLQQYAQNQYGFTDDEWQDETRGSRRDMMRSVRQDIRGDRRQDRRDNKERKFPRAKAIDADRNPRGRGRQVLRNVLSRSLPFGAFLQPKEYGGDLNEYGPGGINDPSEGNVSVSPSAFSMYGYDPISTAPQSSELQNLNAPAAGFRDTSTLNNAMFQKTNKRNLVGVENKRKDMFNIDGESSVNKGNASIRKGLNLFDPNKKTQCGPGTTWNSDTQTCQPTDALDIYATATEQDRGDWVDIGSKAGLEKYDQIGDNRNSRATFGQYGGYMQNGGFYDPYYEEDEEVIMTPEELEQFLAAGGQVEYL